jgi:hypothetical protein
MEDIEEQGEDEMSEADSDDEQKPATTENQDTLESKFKYDIDPFLVRREASLLCLIRRGFYKRVIVFFNEKK